MDPASLEIVLNEVAEQAKSLGIPISPNIYKEVLVNKRAKKRFGCCRMKNQFFQIEISQFVAEASGDAIKEILAHELLHTCPGCQNHSLLWKGYAYKMNQSFGYHIKRTSTRDQLGIEGCNQREKDPKYIFACMNCGTVFQRQRKSPLVTDTKKYRCRCGGRIVQER